MTIYSPSDFWNRPLPTPVVENSPYDKLSRNMGLIVKKKITLAQGAEPINRNLFSFTGPFRLLQLYGVCTRVGGGGSADCDDAWFNTFDGAVTAALTLGGANNGLDMSNITVASVIYRDSKLNAVLKYAKSDQVRVVDAVYEGCELWQGSMITPLTGSTNYIRFTYDSAAASGIDFDMQMFLAYAELDFETPSGLVAV